MGRVGLVAVLLGLVAIFPGCSADQSVLTEREATRLLEEFGKQYCIVIPVGVYRTSPPPLMNDAERAMARSALALQDIGVVTVKSQGNLIENILTVQLRDDFNKANLNPTANVPCLPETTGLIVRKINRIERAQGGTTVKWNAAVVYALYDFPATALAQRYYAAMKAAGGFGKRKGAFLYRQDTFSNKWIYVSVSAADESAPTLSTEVIAAALRRD